MYTIINKTLKTCIDYTGSFPFRALEECLNNGNKIIVISSYSNTIKVPYSVEENGLISWEWEDYDLNTYILKRQ